MAVQGNMLLKFVLTLEKQRNDPPKQSEGRIRQIGILTGQEKRDGS